MLERLRFEGTSKRGGYQESGEFDEIGDLTKVLLRDLDLRERAKGGLSGKRRNWRFDESSPERLRFEGASKRGGYEESGEFDENGEFGNLSKVRRISPHSLYPSLLVVCSDHMW